MIRAKDISLIKLENGKAVYMAELFGLSTDAKPTEGYVNGTTFVEVNTGKLFLFNEDAKTWVEVQ